MASHKAVVEAYIDGFRRTDHAAILACLADDVVWVLHGYRTLRGRDAFDAEIENDAAVGSPTLNLDRLITGDRVSRLETFHINLSGPDDAMFTAPSTAPAG